MPLKPAKETLKLIARELPGVRLSFPNGLRCDQLDDEILDLFEEAGTAMMSLAVETASPRLQKLIGKNLDIGEARTAIHNASKRFIVRTFNMIGFPTETREEALETVRFSADLDHVTSPFLSIVRIYEGTVLYDLLNPDKSQAEQLARQEQVDFIPRLFDQPQFYGDLFSEKLVPLRGQDIQKLRWKWLMEIINNRTRIRNSHRVVQKYLSGDKLIHFYQVLLENPNFNKQVLDKMLTNK